MPMIVPIESDRRYYWDMHNHLWSVYHPDVHPCQLSLASLCGWVQWVLAMVSVTAGEETVSS